MNEPTMNESEQRIKQLQVLKDIALKNPGFVRFSMEIREMGSVTYFS